MLQRLFERVGAACQRQFAQTHHHGQSSAKPVVNGSLEKKKARIVSVCFKKQRRNKMATSKESDKERGKRQVAMNTPPIVSQQEWEAARQQMLVKETAQMRARDALAAERRR